MLQDDEISVKGRVNSVFVLVFFFFGQTGFCVCFTVSSQRPPRPQHAPFCLRACNLRSFLKVCQCAACPGQPRPSDSAGNKKKKRGGCGVVSLTHVLPTVAETQRPHKKKHFTDCEDPRRTSPLSPLLMTAAHANITHTHAPLFSLFCPK